MSGAGAGSDEAAAARTEKALRFKRADDQFKLLRIAVAGAVGVAWLLASIPIARAFAGTRTSLSINLALSVSLALAGGCAAVYAARQRTRAVRAEGRVRKLEARVKKLRKKLRHAEATP